MSTIDSKSGKLIFRSLNLYRKNQPKPTTLKNVLEWKWEDNSIKGKQVGDIKFNIDDTDISHVRETKEIVYREA